MQTDGKIFMLIYLPIMANPCWGYHNTSSVETMLQKLQWPTLEERRKKARLTLLYKVANGKVKIDAGNKLLPPDRLSRH